VFAPPPVNTDASPAQIVAGEALAVTVGAGFTVTVTGTRTEGHDVTAVQEMII
jgi:plastocyanin